MSALNEGGAGGPTPAAPPSRQADEPLLDVFDESARTAANELLGFLLEHPMELDLLLGRANPFPDLADRWREALHTELDEAVWQRVVPFVAGVATVTVLGLG